MANKRIEMVDIKHILRLKLQGHSNRSISRHLGINRKTINKYIQFFKRDGRSYESFLKISNADLNALFPNKTNKKVKNYEVLSSLFSYYERELKRPGATYLSLWKEYFEVHPKGYSYNQFKTHIRAYLGQQQVSMRVETSFL